ncbi:MAG TPA: hypothetical protein VFR01_01175, partial [Geobacterales bacterium]|nr:hypothetical protein [Geobacterales bacterium]
MEKYLIMDRVLAWLTDDHSFVRMTVIALKVLAGVTFLAILTGFVELWKFTERLPGGQIPGSVIFILFYLVAGYLVIHTLWLRAETLGHLPEVEFTLLHLATIFIRLSGELYAAFALPVSIGGGILIWFAGGSGREIIHKVAPSVNMYGDGTFMGGVQQILGGALSSLVALVTAYVTAQLLVLLIDVAMNIKFLRSAA